jgi:hypothetical protein
MQTAQILAIGFVAAADCDEPSSLDELALAAGFQVVDGAVFAVCDSLIVLPANAPLADRVELLASAMGAAAHRWAGEPPGVSPEGIARAISATVQVNPSRRAAS